MNAQELIEAVSKMTEGEIVWHRIYDSRSYLIGWRAELCHGDRTALDCLRNHAVRLLQSLISERDAALARVAESEARCDPQNTTPMIIRDLCELDPADSENLNVICVHVDDLRLVLNERMKPCEHDFDEAPGQGYFCRNCGVPKS